MTTVEMKLADHTWDNPDHVHEAEVDGELALGAGNAACQKFFDDMVGGLQEEIGSSALTIHLTLHVREKGKPETQQTWSSQ